jgi:hypothetical protein
MAKKPSSKSNKAKRSVDQSAVKGGGIMSINKAKTSLGMKIVIVFIIVAFVAAFFYGGIAGIVSLFTTQGASTSTTSTVDPVTQIKTKYDPQVKAFDTLLTSNPTSYTVLVNLSNVHYSYAQELAQASQTSTTVAMAAAQEWLLAKTTFEKAAKVKKLGKNEMVDYSVTQFYSAQTTDGVLAAIKTGTEATKLFPTFPSAYFNLAIFYEAIGMKPQSIAAFQRYIVLDPKGVAGNPPYAVQQLKTLGGSVPATTGVAPSTTTTP